MLGVEAELPWEHTPLHPGARMGVYTSARPNTFHYSQQYNRSPCVHYTVHLSTRKVGSHLFYDLDVQETNLSFLTDITIIKNCGVAYKIF